MRKKIKDTPSAHPGAWRAQVFDVFMRSSILTSR